MVPAVTLFGKLRALLEILVFVSLIVEAGLWGHDLNTPSRQGPYYVVEFELFCCIIHFF